MSEGRERPFAVGVYVCVFDTSHVLCSISLPLHIRRAAIGRTFRSGGTLLCVAQDVLRRILAVGGSLAAWTLQLEHAGPGLALVHPSSLLAYSILMSCWLRKSVASGLFHSANPVRVDVGLQVSGEERKLM